MYVKILVNFNTPIPLVGYIFAQKLHIVCPVNSYNESTKILYPNCNVTQDVSGRIKLSSQQALGELTYRGKDLMRFECSEQLFDANMQISPGICQQFADVVIYDRTYILHALSERNLLSIGPEVTILTWSDNVPERIIGKFNISEWDIESTESDITIKCVDNTDSLNNIQVIMQNNKAYRSIHMLLDLVFNQAKNVLWGYIDNNTETYCKEIITPNSWYKGDTLFNMLNKICTLGQLRIYWYIDRYIVARCY